MEVAEKQLYPFHHANIHERRGAAVVCRAFPLLFFAGFLATVAFGAARHVPLLLAVCAASNVAMWLWISSTAVLGLLGAWSAHGQIEAAAARGAEEGAAAAEDGVVHLIVLPNYKEDEEMLRQTLLALAEAEGSRSFRVVLGMEAREGESARLKGERLCESLGGRFASLLVTSHPEGLTECHLDGTSDEEVPGKASNLKWAVARGYEACQRAGLAAGPGRVVLTVADADCIFHPGYFRHVAKDFLALGEAAAATAAGSGHPWAMWQAPQLPFRNYYESPVCSRAWGYVACVYEFGGVSGLAYGGHQMVFSAYSLPLQLALSAQAWDGDVMAEDHHAYIKCFFHSAWRGALPGGGATPLLQVRPVLLPVKSTSVASPKGYWQSWVERWHQAKRHAQGVAELSYALLATYDALRTLPFSAYSPALLSRMGKVVVRLFCIHLLPIVQGASMAVLSVYWFWHRRRIPTCPDRIWLADLNSREFLCGLAGAWALVWPMIIPMALVMLANLAFIWVTFLAPARRGGGIWEAEDGGVPKTCGSALLTVAAVTLVDLAVFIGPLMFPYGFLVELLAFWNVCFHGNRGAEYVTAAKGATSSLAACASAQKGYGAAGPDPAVAEEGFRPPQPPPT